MITPLDEHSPLITKLLCAFLDNCSTMQPSAELLRRPDRARQTYDAILRYMRVIVSNQGEHWIADTSTRLMNLCNSNKNVIQMKPFLLISACFYVDAAAYCDHFDLVEPLLRLILNICGIDKDQCDSLMGCWNGLDDAINTIYDRYNAPQRLHLPAPPPDPDSAASLTNPNGHDNV